MSIQSQINRIKAARDTIRSRLSAIGLVSSEAKIDECAAVMDRINLEMRRCTVKFTGTAKLYNIAYTEVVNGIPVARKVYVAGATSYTLENVAAQSILVVGINGSGTITTTGGASDGNWVSHYGVATLDGCGPCGANLHTKNEYLKTASVEQRLDLMHLLLRKLYPEK